ncbi:hypothetical protein CLV45_0656 [Hymenobacter chitinivorans DSM 11115]|uniref:Uncharacterized protein n=2 Tax=Hymenobacter chitinivorans TaxID=89969 RepID=A0A2M9BMW9_9BACT|nr:hypothetical protein CLV45_0656 [Hymenobacter chitinivorans DSM 11115]
MEAPRKKLTIWNRWTTHLLVLVVGIAAGALVMQYSLLAGPYEMVPKEIVREPPPNATWCFPNTSLRAAQEFQRKLRQARTEEQGNDSATLRKVLTEYNLKSEFNKLLLIGARKERYEVLVRGVN